MDELNEAEDEEHGDDDGDGGLPAELQRPETAAREDSGGTRATGGGEGREAGGEDQKSFADPDANMMKTGEGSFQYCYNAQVATSEDGIIVATGLATSPSDQDRSCR